MRRHRLEGVSMAVVACVGLGVRVCDARNKGEGGKAALGVGVEAKDLDGGDAEKKPHTESGAKFQRDNEPEAKEGEKRN